MDTDLTDQKPAISVLMPVYNGEKYLSEAVESILIQTFTDFEFIIINDGSTDRTIQILEGYQQKDKRIQLFNQPNQGLIRSLNRGLELAKGRYIARMDADDISLPDRLAVQVRYMDENPDTGVCGTWIKIIGGRNFIKKYPMSPEEIRSKLLFECPLAHPSAMIRKDMLIKHNLFYDLSSKHVEDYELWTRVSKIFRLANIPEVLLKYRLHTEQISITNADAQVAAKFEISIKYLSQLYEISSEEELSVHRLFFPQNDKLNIDSLSRGHEWLYKLIRENSGKHVFPEPEFSSLLAEKWLMLCIKARYIGFRVIIVYWNSALRLPVSKCLVEIVKLLIYRPYKTSTKLLF